MTQAIDTRVADLREAAIERLAHHVGAERAPGLFHWTDGKGSLAACLIGSADPDVWRERLGLAPWVAFALDTVTNGLATPQAQLFAGALLRSAPGEVDARRASHAAALILGALGDAPLNPLLDEALAAVKAAHAALARGDEVEPPHWRRLRRLAIDASNAADGGKDNPATDAEAEGLVALGAVIEAAAWDPRGSATMVSEVLRHWMHLAVVRAKVTADWSPQDDERIKLLLEEMSEKYIVPDPQEKRDVFQLLEVHYPAEAARLRASIAHANSAYRSAAEKAGDLLMIAVSSA